LLGYTKNDKSSEAWPIVIPGEDKPIPSNRIEDYVNAEVYHYYEFYIYTKHAGSPLSGGWTEWPAWIPQILTYFDNALDAIRAHNEREACKRLGHG